jgi:isopenicillin N synthase-like dioxygenase
MTLHLFESAPGFQALTLDSKQWIDVSFPPGETVVIPSTQMQLRSEGKLTALCHRVVATEETAHTGRFSAVCFVQFSKTPKYDKDKHGRLQEKDPGFNYGMPLEEFARLFKI